MQPLPRPSKMLSDLSQLKPQIKDRDVKQAACAIFPQGLLKTKTASPISLLYLLVDEASDLLLLHTVCVSVVL